MNGRGSQEIHDRSSLLSKFDIVQSWVTDDSNNNGEGRCPRHSRQRNSFLWDPHCLSYLSFSPPTPSATERHQR